MGYVLGIANKEFFDLPGEWHVASYKLWAFLPQGARSWDGAKLAGRSRPCGLEKAFGGGHAMRLRKRSAGETRY